MARAQGRGGKLDEEPFSYDFSYDISGDGKVFISWHGKLVTTLKENNARRFLDKVTGLDSVQAQLAMAKVTGNFRRGNER